MGDINREMQERVWQRVRGQEQPQAESGEPGPQALLLGELTDAGLLRKTGNAEILHLLARQATERANILRGLCLLMQTEVPGILPTAGEPGPAVLRLLMGSLLRRHREYCRCSDHGEYGPIYRHLAQSAQDSCALLAKYIGMTPLRNRKK